MIGRLRAGIGALLVVGAAILAIGPACASAAYVHTIVGGEYGKEGPKSTGLGAGCHLAYNGTSGHLYLAADGKVYGLAVSPGSAAPLGGNFPFNAGISTACGEPDIEVESSGSGNIYGVQSGSSGQIYGWDSSGEPLGGSWPVSVSGGGEICGVDVGPSGGPWAGDYSQQKIVKYSASGEATGTISVGFGVCKLAVNHLNGDVYAAAYGGSQLVKLTAESGYTTKVNFPSAGGEPGLAVNGAEHKLYVGNGSTSVKVYDTETGGLIETITLPAPGGQGLAVDEANDTLFVTIGGGASGYIQERPGVVVPDVTVTGTSGFATLHGHVDPAGGGEVTSCEFEFSTASNFSGASTAPCEPSIPPGYSSQQDVHADVSALVTGETQYHYRLVAGNANGSNTSAPATFIPHFVQELTTEPASDIERTSAKLTAAFQGTNEETHYYFKWGEKSVTEHSTTPEVAAPGVGLTTIASEVSGLEPSTVYRYKVVATNSKGTSEGGELTFETKPAVTGLITEAATNIKTSTAELHGSFAGDGLTTTYYFEWGSSRLYGNVTPSGEIENPNGPVTIPPASISGLQSLHTYHFRAVASNSFGTTYGPDETFTTFTAPIITSLSSSGVTATTADLHAVINPHGTEAEYHFEYGPTAEYGTSVPIPNQTLAASGSPQPVEVHLSGLNGGVYHFRVVASNVYGESASGDQTFNFYPPVCPNASLRQQSGANTLPDCRAYELVSPEDAGITIIYPASVPFSPVATSPSRLAFVGAYGLISGAGEAANYVGDLYVATRTNQGWKTKYVGLPSSQFGLAGGAPWTYDWSGRGQYEPDKWEMDVLTDQSLSKIVDWNDGYYPCNPKVCQGFGNGEGVESSNAPYVWDSVTGRQMDRWPTNVGAIPGGEYFKGRTAASADLSHFVFSSDIPFAPGAEPGDVYDNNTVKDTLSIISFNGNRERLSGAVPVQVSEDGSHILMTVGGARRPGGWYNPTSGPGELYMRVNDSNTYDIAAGHAVSFAGMTPDGKKVYFTSNEQLLPEDEDSSTDLYMWSESSSSPEHLTLISKGNEPNAGNTDACSASWTSKCDVVPISLISEYTRAQGGRGGSPYSDSSIASQNGDVYFLSPEQLAGSDGVNGQENVYDYREGKLQFVVSLNPAGTACVQDQGSTMCSETAIARMEVTPDDSYMAFLTGSQVTGYENHGFSEMYLYRPATEEVTCVSCIPSGAPPTADVTASHNGLFMTDDGRTFFETSDALVPQDTNEASDVYEYVEGRPQLITGGTNVGNDTHGLATLMALPGLVGVSANGTDVYFATYDTLVGQDRNGEAVKIYDARSSGGFQYAPPPPPCAAADECHGVGSEPPPNPPSGTVAELGSSGNVPAPAKKHAGRHKKRARHKGRARHRKARAAGRRHHRAHRARRHHRKAQRKGHRHV